MKHLANRLKIAALSAAIMLPMMPSIANAEIVIDDAVSAGQVKEDLATVEFTPLEKKLMNGKGFDYRYDLGGDYDYSDGKFHLMSIPCIKLMIGLKQLIINPVLLM